MRTSTIRKPFTLIACALLGLALASAVALLEAKPAYAVVDTITLTYKEGTDEVEASQYAEDWRYDEDSANRKILELENDDVEFIIQAESTNGESIPLPDFISVAIRNGSVLAGTGNEGIAGKVINNGGSIIKGGLFLGLVTNGYGTSGTITGGTFKGKVNNKDGSIISDGIFENEVVNQLSATITGGTYHNTIINRLGGAVSGVTYGPSASLERWVSVRMNNVKTNPEIVLDEDRNTYVVFSCSPDQVDDEVTFSLEAAAGFALPSESDVQGSKPNVQNLGMTYDPTQKKVTIPADKFETPGDIVVEAWGTPLTPTVGAVWTANPGEADDGKGSVKIASAANDAVKLYYTTDESDPRKATSLNELADSANPYSGPIDAPPGETTKIRAVAVARYGGFSRISEPSDTFEVTPVDYDVTLSGSPWVKYSGSSVKLTATGPNADTEFVGVYTDGVEVDAANYTTNTLKQGEIAIALSSSYLNRLSVGNHTVQVVFLNGASSALLKVNPQPSRPPQVKEVDSERLSVSDARIEIASDKAGTVYYQTVAEGGSWNQADAKQVGSAAANKPFSFTAELLEPATGEAQDVLVRVKSVAGLMSDPLRIQLPLWQEVVSVEVAAEGGVATVKAGSSLAFSAEVSGWGLSDADKAVSWSALAPGGGALIEGVSLDASGVLTVARGVPNGTVIVVSATSQFDETKKGTAEVVVAAGQGIYNMVSGAGATWTKGSAKPLVFVVDAPYDQFQSVWIDDKELVRGTDYQDRSGSTVVSIEPAFLEGLALGEHRISLVFADGEAFTTFSVVEPTTPQPNLLASTGDTTTPWPWLLLATSATFAISLTLFLRRKAH